MMMIYIYDPNISLAISFLSENAPYLPLIFSDLG